MGYCSATQSMEAQENQGASRADGSSRQREPWEVGGGGRWVAQEVWGSAQGPGQTRSSRLRSVSPLAAVQTAMNRGTQQAGCGQGWDLAGSKAGPTLFLQFYTSK